MTVMEGDGVEVGEVVMAELPVRQSMIHEVHAVVHMIMINLIIMCTLSLRSRNDPLLSLLHNVEYLWLHPHGIIFVKKPSEIKNFGS